MPQRTFVTTYSFQLETCHINKEQEKDGQEQVFDAIFMLCYFVVQLIKVEMEGSIRLNRRTENGGQLVGIWFNKLVCF